MSLDLEKLTAVLAAGTQGKWTATSSPSDSCCWKAHVETAARDDGGGALFDVADVSGDDDARQIAALHNAAPELLARARQRDEARRLVNEYYLEHQLDAGGVCECATCGRVRVARGAAAEAAKEAAGA